MLVSSIMVRFILLTGLIGMLVLSIHYLRGRKLTLEAFIGWGLFALLLPLVGPFIVVAQRPGRPSRAKHA